MTSLAAIAKLYTETEPERHAAEVRFVASLPSRAHRIDQLLGPGGIAERRGREAAEQIIADLVALGVETM